MHPLTGMGAHVRHIPHSPQRGPQWDRVSVALRGPILGLLIVSFGITSLDNEKNKENAATNHSTL